MKNWTIFYMPDDLIGIIKMKLFGKFPSTDYDDLKWGPSMLEGVDTEKDTAKFFWYAQIVTIICNANYSEMRETVKAKYEKHIAEVTGNALKNMIMPDDSQGMQAQIDEDMTQYQ